MEEKNKIRNIIAFLALLVLIFGFPALSWFYLKKGAEVRISTIKELRIIKPKLNLSFLSSDSTVFQCDTNLNKIKVLIDLDKMNPILDEDWKKLDQQFKDSEEVLLCFFSDKKTKWEGFSMQSLFFRRNETFHSLFDTIPASIILLDVQNNLRHVFKDIKKEDFKEIVLYTATLIPTKKTPKTKLLRDKEK